MADDANGPNQQSSQQNPLSKKLSKILEMNLDNDRDTLQALDVLSGFLQQNTLQARRNLRGDLELRSVSLNRSFLECLRGLVDHVEGLKGDVAQMRESCEGMQRRLAEAKGGTAGLLRETAELKQRGRLLDVSSRAVGAFLAKFELRPDELAALSAEQRKGGSGGGGEGVGDKFFQALARVKAIHEDCKALLRTSQQKAGLEIMESMALHLETSYEQLYHWTQGRCRAMTGEIPDGGGNLRRALEELRERPVLLQYCLDEYNGARRMALVRLFIDALTREGAGGGGGVSSRRPPIELHSHDPLRYCSDMLGWLHQAVATESDHIVTLLPQDFVREKAAAMLEAITEGACHPLRVRIEHVVVSTTESVTAYQLLNLFRYYGSVFQTLLGPAAPLTLTISDLQELQSKMFYSALNGQTTRILDSQDPTPSSLVPSPAVTAMLALLQKVLSSRDMNSLAHNNQELDLKRVLSLCLDPLLQHCRECAGKLGRPEDTIYTVNCLHAIHSVVSLYEFTESHLEVLSAQLRSSVDSLSGELFLQLAERAGLAEFYGKHVRSPVGAGAGAAVAEAKDDFGLLESCAEKVTEMVALPEHQLLPQCRFILATPLRAEVRRVAGEQFVAAYSAVHGLVKGKAGQADATRYLPYTPEQIKQLLL